MVTVLSGGVLVGTLLSCPQTQVQNWIAVSASGFDVPKLIKIRTGSCRDCEKTQKGPTAICRSGRGQSEARPRSGRIATQPCIHNSGPGNLQVGEGTKHSAPRLCSKTTNLAFTIRLGKFAGPHRQGSFLTWPANGLTVNRFPRVACSLSGGALRFAPFLTCKLP